MDRLAARLCKNGENIFKRLLELRNKLIALKMLIGIPANLTGYEHNLARRHAYAVCIADRRFPSLWMKNKSTLNPVIRRPKLRSAILASMHWPQRATHGAAFVGRDLTQLCNISDHDL